jgi:hypothetical protein
MREAPLPDIIQLVCNGGKTGAFHVIEENRRCSIFLKDGVLWHAESEAMRGAEAVTYRGTDAIYAVCHWLDGTYVFQEGEEAKERTVQRPNTFILMEMGRRFEAWKIISQQVRGLEWYPVALPGAEKKPMLSVSQHEILYLSIGEVTVSEVARLVNRDVMAVAKDLYGLIVNGAVKMYKTKRDRKSTDQ